MTRDERQDEFIRKFIDAGGIGTLEAATAFGKTVVGLKIIKQLRRNIPGRKVIIVVPQEYLKTQWEEALKKWKLMDNTSVHIINSFVKKKHECSLLILDECHRYAAETFSQVFEVVSYKFLLGLTAMVKRLDKKQYVITSRAPVLDRITLEEARICGYIAPYQEFNLGITLNEEDLAAYKKIEEFYETSMGIFQWDFGMMKKCISSYKPLKISMGGKEEYLGSACEELAREYGWKGNSPREAHEALMKHEKNIWGGDPNHPYHPEKLMIRAVNGIKSIRRMKDIIFRHPSKIDIATEILNRLPGMKAITFAELVDTANKMAKRVPHSEVYHSSLVIKDSLGKKLSKTKARDMAIASFKSPEVRVIHTAKALDEGADFPEVSLGIRISGSSSPTQQTQRRGRIVRKHEDKEAVMINLYLKDTKEVQWLSKSQSYSEDIIWVDSIDEIKTYL